MNRAGQAGTLNVRILSYAGGIPGMKAINGGKPSDWLYRDRLHLGGVKLYADGALGSRGAWLKQPYADKPDTRGLQFLTDAQILEQANAAAAGGYQLAIHAIGDAANAQVISTYEKLNATYGKDRRWRIEHFQIADPADIPRLKPAGIIASMQPTHQTSDRLMAEARLGPDRLKGAYAWQTVEKLGIPIALGSDFPVESPNPFPGLAAAVSRRAAGGRKSGSAWPRHCTASPLERPMPALPRTRSAAWSPANGPISSSSTATSARAVRRLWLALRCWRPGWRAKKSGNGSELFPGLGRGPGRCEAAPIGAPGPRPAPGSVCAPPFPSAFPASGSAAALLARPGRARTTGRAARPPCPGFREIA